MLVEILMTPGCPNGRRAAALVDEIAGTSNADVRSVLVTTDADAERLAFPGSPTVRVDGVDVDPHPPSRVSLG